MRTQDTAPGPRSRRPRCIWASHSFTVGDRLLETCLEVTLLRCEAAFTRDRLPLLQRASSGWRRSNA